MNIKISDDLYLRSDRYCCWIVKVNVTKKGKNIGKEYEDVLGYYRKPSDAFVALMEHEIRASDATTLKELKLAVQTHNGFVRDFLKDRIELEEKKNG